MADATGMMMTDRVIIVTGASSGIGAGCAILFSKLNAKLVLTGRNAEALEDTKSKCAPNNTDDKIICIACDLTKAADQQRLVNDCLTKFGQINCLINAAGIVVRGDVLGTELSEYDKVMDINVRSVVCLTRLCLPHIIKTKGTIVNVSSINGICSFPNVTYYCMSKSALDQFTKCLALEMAPHQVRVNAVNPGVIKTNVHLRAGVGQDDYVKFLEHSKTTHALGRIGTVDEVARAVAFLASDASSFTTGQLLKVEGGRGIMSPR